MKALQQVIDSQNVRLAELQVAGGGAGEAREDTNTGQCEQSGYAGQYTIEYLHVIPLWLTKVYGADNGDNTSYVHTLVCTVICAT